MHSPRVPSQEELLQVSERAGFATYTPLQERLVPALLKGRDVVVEAAAGSGRTVGVVLPLIVGLRGAGLAPRALILSGAPEDVGKISRAAARITRVVREAPAFVPLGEVEDARREQRRLEKGATIVAGTTERVIDHLRRGSLTFMDLACLVVVVPEGQGAADFVKDVQFIAEKIAGRAQTVLVASSALPEDHELLQLVRHPTQVSSTGPVEMPVVSGGHLYMALEDAARPAERALSLARVLLGMRIPTAVVYHPPRVEGRVIVDALRAAGLRAAAIGTGGRQQERRPAEAALARRGLDVLVVPLGAAASSPELQDASPTHVVFFDAGGLRPAPGRVRPGASVIALVDRADERDVARLQQAMGVTMSKGQIPGDEDVLKGAIDRIVARLGTEDAAELALLRAHIRRQVPFLKRSLFAAALLRAQLPVSSSPALRAGEQAGQRQGPRSGGQRPAAGRPGAEQRPSQRPPGGQRPAEERAQPATEGGRPPRGRFGRIAGAPPAPQKADTHGDGAFAQLFVSIGRNRRVFARDLTALFTESLSLGPGEIGGVRVFEKYSFVDIAPAKAEEAISKLSGTELKGRTITVNYAKKKEEKEGA